MRKKKVQTPPVDQAPPPEKIEEASAPPKQLDPATAEKVRLADLANIVKKVKSGKPLTKYERGVVDAAQPGRAASPAQTAEPAAEWVSSYEKLGEIFGLHRASFPRIIRDHPDDAPRARQNGDHHVPAWREFFEAHPGIRRQEEACPQESDIKREILLQELRGITHKNDVEDEKYILVLDLTERLTRVATEQKKILREQLEGPLPAKIAAGMKVDDVRNELRRVVDDICSRMEKLMDDLGPAPTDATP